MTDVKDRVLTDIGAPGSSERNDQGPETILVKLRASGSRLIFESKECHGFDQASEELA